MALQYRITKRSNSLQNKTPQYILQAISKSTIGLDQLSDDISNECSLHKVDVQAVLIALWIKMDFYLQNGHTIDMVDVGKFKINYQPSLKLKRLLKAGVKVYKEGSRHL